MFDFAPGAVLAGYRIESLLGRGGMGAVYRATQLALRRQVALKVIAAAFASDQAFRERFQREALAAASIDHPNVVPVFEAGDCDGVLFMSMRLVEGETLGDAVRRRGRLDPELAVRLAEQVATALDAAHARGVVHRDVKPGNVLITGAMGEEHVYLADFGIAKLVGGEALTDTGRAVGTLGYLAPEVLRGELVDGRADTYGLGCVLFEALTGEVPYPRESKTAVLSAHLFEPVPSVRDRAPAVHPELDALVQWTLAKRPEDRPQRAGELAAALRAGLTGAWRPRSVLDAAAPVRRRGPVRTNLPHVARALIGRERDLRELVAICRAAESRLITLTGPAGVGKTEVALGAAQALVADFTDGVHWVELESLSDAVEVPGAIARALELADEPGVTALQRVIEHARQRRMLLVLDNFEHVLDAALDVMRIIECAPLTRLLVTSQAPLHVRTERSIELRPLELPGTAADVTPDLLAEVPSVALLVERARSVVPEFAITPANAVATAELCRRLDGLPLALELAAARLSLLEPAELLARVEKSLDALGRGGRDLPARHRGLRAALDWTTGQLSAAERTLFARLAVFAGGLTVAMAEVVGDGDVLDGLDALRNVSLLRRDANGRLSMPPPVRTYALELLDEMGAVDSAYARHAAAMLDLCERQNWVRDLAGGLRGVRAEADNLRQAMRWTRDARPVWHARLVAAACQLLVMAGHEVELAPEVNVALDHTRDPQLRARLLLQQAFVLEGTGELDPYHVAIAACRRHADEPVMVEALCSLSNLHAARGEGAQALVTAREAQALADRLGDRSYLDMAELVVGQGLRVLGRTDEALSILHSVANRARPDSFAALGGVSCLADAALAAGDAAAALDGYCRALRETHGIGTPPNDALQLDGAAMALAALDRHEEAATVAAVSDRVRREFSCATAPEWLAGRQNALEPSLEAIGPKAERRCGERVESMGLERAIAWVAALGQGSRTAA